MDYRLKADRSPLMVKAVQKATGLIATGHVADLKEILMHFNRHRVVQLAEDQLPEFIDMLEDYDG